MLPRGAKILAGLTVFALVAMSGPAQAAMTPEELVKVVEKAKILSPDYQIRAAVGSGEAEISTYRNPKASDKDCKIDAVLIAKEVMQADPSSISRVRVRFYDTTSTNRYREVNVREGDVKAFGSGQMSPDALLSSIDISVGDLNARYGQHKGTSGVASGPLQGERLQMLGRIQSLKDRGIGVQSFMALFARMEEQVGGGSEAAVIDGLNFLNRKLNEAEEAYNQSHHAGGGGTAERGPGNFAPGPRGNFSAGPHADPRSGGFSQGPTAGGPGDERTQGGPPNQPGNMMDKMRQQLGDLTPAMGPMLKRRYSVARKILDLKDQGKVVDYYMRLYRDIEDLAARQDGPALQMKLRLAEHELGLTSMDRE